MFFEFISYYSEKGDTSKLQRAICRQIVNITGINILCNSSLVLSTYDFSTIIGIHVQITGFSRRKCS